MKKIILILILAISIGAAALFVRTAVFALISSPTDTTMLVPDTGAQQESARDAVAQGDLPMRLKIPSLGIDADVQSVGINGKGNMASPGNFTDVGWYSGGPLPGQVGSAVIDGHVDNGLGMNGVFKHLGEIQIGDEIVVSTLSGRELHFVVEEIAPYPYTAVPLERLFLRADMPRLNLVTCEGRWVKRDDTYDHRLVIYARLMDSSALQRP